MLSIKEKLLERLALSKVANLFPTGGIKSGSNMIWRAAHRFAHVVVLLNVLAGNLTVQPTYCSSKLHLLSAPP